MCDQILSEDEYGVRQDGPVSFVDELVVAMTNARIYDRKHPRLATAVDTLAQGLASLCRETESSSVRLGAADGFLFFRRRPLLGASLAARRLTSSKPVGCRSRSARASTSSSRSSTSSHADRRR